MQNGKAGLRRLQQLAKDFVLWCARKFGTKLVDSRTGEPIGRVLILPWKGKLAIFGLTKAVRPEFLAQTRVTYAKQDLGFQIVPEPDYPNVRSTDGSSHAPKF
jgi:hypothetical protein